MQKDYTNSGFDRGHNFPAADAVCDRVSNEESFYFSNMTAQYPALNRGDWKSLETVVRDVAAKNDSTKVWCGSVGEIKKIGKVSVPKQCWKVVYVKATNEWTAYLFNNYTTKADGVENNKVRFNIYKKKRIPFKEPFFKMKNKKKSDSWIFKESNMNTQG